MGGLVIIGSGFFIISQQVDAMVEKLEQSNGVFKDQLEAKMEMIQLSKADMKKSNAEMTQSNAAMKKSNAEMKESNAEMN